MFQDGTRVLVTGGAGFLGSFLCERLLAQGSHVICADNYFTGSRDNIAHLLGNPYFEVIRHDITIPLFVEVDRIFNLACPASPVHYQFDPVQTTKTSVHGAINMLNRVQFETRRFQFRSSPPWATLEGWYYGFQTGRGLVKQVLSHAQPVTGSAIAARLVSRVRWAML